MKKIISSEELENPVHDILNILNQPLPMPYPQLTQVQKILPSQLQTPQLHTCLFNANKEQIDNIFSQMIDGIDFCFGDGQTNAAIVEQVVSFLEVYEQKKYLTHLLDVSFHHDTPVERLYELVLKSIAESHCMVYGMEKLPELYEEMIADAKVKYIEGKDHVPEYIEYVKKEKQAEMMRKSLIDLTYSIEEPESDTEHPQELIKQEQVEQQQKKIEVAIEKQPTQPIVPSENIPQPKQPQSKRQRYFNKFVGVKNKVFEKAAGWFGNPKEQKPSNEKQKVKVIKPQDGKSLKLIQHELKKRQLTEYRPLPANSIPTLQKIYDSFSLQTVQAIPKEPYLTVLSEAFHQTIVTINQSVEQEYKKYKVLFDPILEQLNLMKMYIDSVETKKSKKSPTECWMLVIVYVFTELRKNYDPIRRRILYQILKKVHEKKFNYNEIIRWLQNNGIQKKSFLPTQKPEQFTTLCEQLHNYRQSFLDKANLAYIPKLKFVKLSDSSISDRKVVNIFISGFLSEDSDQKIEWADLVGCMPDSEIYAVQWQSDTVTNLVKFFMLSAKDLVMGLGRITEQLNKKFVDNPFNPAFNESKVTGRYLAELLPQLFPNKFINIYSYSLGTQVTKQFLRRMIETNKQSMLNKVYMLGGVSDTPDFQNVIASSSYPICIYNCYTNHDAVLRHLFSLLQPGNTPIGLNCLYEYSVHDIINMDCTNFISGHLAFRRHLGLLGKLLEVHHE